MRRLISVFLLLACFLSGCKKDDALQRMLSLRQNLLTGKGCSFDTHVTVDYGDQLFTFSTQCSADSNGTVEFVITDPETLAGINGKIDSENGHLSFDEKVIIFDLLVDGEISPIATPWLLVKTILGGYITAGGADGEYYIFQVDDSYEEDPLRLDIWLDNSNLPVAADIIWNGRRVAAITIENFCVL